MLKVRTVVTLGDVTVTKDGSDGLVGCWARSVSCFGWLHRCAHFVKIHQAVYVRLAHFLYIYHTSISLLKKKLQVGKRHEFTENISCTTERELLKFFLTPQF